MAAISGWGQILSTFGIGCLGPAPAPPCGSRQPMPYTGEKPAWRACFS